MESDTSSSEKTQDLKSTCNSTDTSNYCEHSCCCHLLAQNKGAAELTAERNDYLRQNVMVPLTWALAKALEYKPTDPVHYVAYQLLRWIRNVPESKKNCLQQIIALATIEMDQKLIEKKRLEEEELITNLNERSIKNTVCIDPNKIQCIKEEYWKCMSKSLKEYETCEFPEICSSCKINVSNNSG